MKSVSSITHTSELGFEVGSLEGTAVGIPEGSLEGNLVGNSDGWQRRKSK